MDTLTILFAGLIAHVMTDGGAQRAVLVAAPQHEARLVVDAADIVDGAVFPLAGEHVAIEGLPRGEVTFAASYLLNVPSLTRISDATALIPEIERAAPHAAVAAYLDLPAGTYSAEETWGARVTFGRSRSQCVASTVAFRAPAAGPVTFRAASGKFVRVRAGATVRVVNDPPAGSGGSHFHMYASLLRDATHLGEPVASGTCGAAARGRRRVAGHSVHIECSNSQYP